MTHAETLCTRLHEFSLTHTNCHAYDTRAERVLNACQRCVASNLSLVCTVVSQGSRESLRAQGKIYVVTALIEYLTVLLEYIDFWGP